MTDLSEMLGGFSPRGRLQPQRALAELTWLRVGGPADWLFQPADRQDLAGFLAALPRDVSITPLGVGSNLIIRDGGLPGVAIRLGRGFNGFEVLDGHRVRVGAALLDSMVARRAAEAGIAGLEFLRTIPGAIGGAVKMNAGCYGSYTADFCKQITLIDREGAERTIAGEDAGFAYRSSEIPADSVIVEAVLQGRAGIKDASENLMAEYIRRREESQPTKDRSAGSTFRNPAGYSSTGDAEDPMDLKAWKLIDDAGCRGLIRGGAQMSPKHSNFLVNTGDATAEDLEMLGEEVRARVKSHSGHELTWEIQRIGVKVAAS
ncbi:MAG: UDP-N-acetylmuramate dehydrogenase [Pseudomonadota bacterium]